jgi:hypothetical protein
MADGRSIDVRHPECIAYLASAPGAMVAQQDGTFLFVELVLMLDLEFAGRES